MPAYLSSRYDVVGKIGEGTYGEVYQARTREAVPRLLAIKTFKPGKVGYACHGAKQQLQETPKIPTKSKSAAQTKCAEAPDELVGFTVVVSRFSMPYLQEGEGVSPTAIREIMLLRELNNPHIVSLEATLICRKVLSLQRLARLLLPMNFPHRRAMPSTHLCFDAPIVQIDAFQASISSCAKLLGSQAVLPPD